MIAVLEGYQDDLGKWRILQVDIHESHDLIMVPSFEGMASFRKPIESGNKAETLQLYELVHAFWITYHDWYGRVQ